MYAGGVHMLGREGAHVSVSAVEALKCASVLSAAHDAWTDLTKASGSATPGETLAQFVRHMVRVQDHAKSDGFEAAGGGGLREIGSTYQV